MTRFALLFALIALVATSARAQESAPEAPPLSATVAAAIEGTTVPALGLLVIRDGQVVDQAVAGVRELGSRSAVTADDRWNLGSDGKAMTATMIARLVERSVLGWAAPLSAMLPDLAADMRPEYRDVTLLELMSHRTGLPENLSDMTYFQTFYADTRPLPEQRLAYLRRALAGRLPSRRSARPGARPAIPTPA